MDKQILIETGALSEGHFELSSGLHSDMKIQCAKLLQTYKGFKLINRFVSENCEEIPNCDIIIGGAYRAIKIASILVWSLSDYRNKNIRCIWCEKMPEIDFNVKNFDKRLNNSIPKIKSGKFQLHEGFEIRKGEKVLIATDVVTTGKTIGEIAELVTGYDGEVVGAISIVDKRKKNNNFPDNYYFPNKIIYECEKGVYTGIKPFISLIQLDIKTWEKENCPLCKQHCSICLCTDTKGVKYPELVKSNDIIKCNKCNGNYVIASQAIKLGNGK